MGRGISFADRFQPDFGLPYPRGWIKDLEQLSEDELIQLAGIKQAIDSGSDIDIPSLPERLRFQSARILSEKSALEDPIQYGWTLDSWREVMENWKKYSTHFVFGGNRSSKSVMASRLIVWAMMNIPECRIRCYQVNQDKSIQEQQAYIWDALPARYKQLDRKRGSTHAINYTQANGFTGDKLILPPLPGCDRGGECIFGTYQQYRNDPQVVEGFWAHLIWADEEMDLKMFERLLYRIKDANGRILNTFTTIKGWTPLVEDVIGKATTIRRRYAPLLKKQIPVAQESVKRRGARIYYFWTEDNPFLPPATMEGFKGRPEDEIKATAYGIPTKNAVSTFTLFDEDVHIIKHEEISFLKDDFKGHLTRYHVIDPAGDKPWFMIWAAVDALNRITIYREWPDESYGAWGEQGATPDGARGPAQKSNNYTIDDYVSLMKSLEGEEEVFERLIDPRLSVTPTQTRDGAVTIMGELEDAGIIVIAAPGNRIDPGLDLIKNALKYDQTKPISSTNVPKLRISDRCQNLIDSFKNYSNFSQHEVWKDPIDCVRYLLEAGADHVSEKSMRSTGDTFSY